MTEAFRKVSELSFKVRVVAGLLYPLLCPGMSNTEIDLPIWEGSIGTSSSEKEATS